MNASRNYTKKQNGDYDVTVYLGAFEHRYQIRPSGTDKAQNVIHVADMVERRIGVAFTDEFTEDITYQLKDHLSSNAMTITKNGTLLSKEEFYPFGETSYGSYSKKRYRFTGKEQDECSGLYYYGARYYAAWSCRFVSIDPIYSPAESPYAYAGNNPIMYNDPTGMVKEGAGVGGGGGGKDGGGGGGGARDTAYSYTPSDSGGGSGGGSAKSGGQGKDNVSKAGSGSNSFLNFIADVEIALKKFIERGARSVTNTETFSDFQEGVFEFTKGVGEGFVMANPELLEDFKSMVNEIKENPEAFLKKQAGAALDFAAYALSSEGLSDAVDAAADFPGKVANTVEALGSVMANWDQMSTKQQGQVVGILMSAFMTPELPAGKANKFVKAAKYVRLTTQSARAAGKKIDQLVELGRKKIDDIHVESYEDAQEVLFRKFHSHGYLNTTGLNAKVSKLYNNGTKAKTYHWDLNPTPGSKHASAHLQVHLEDERVIRIFFPMNEAAKKHFKSNYPRMFE